MAAVDNVFVDSVVATLVVCCSTCCVACLVIRRRRSTHHMNCRQRRRRLHYGWCGTCGPCGECGACGSCGSSGTHLHRCGDQRNPRMHNCVSMHAGRANGTRSLVIPATGSPPGSFDPHPTNCTAAAHTALTITARPIFTGTSEMVL